VFCVTPPCRGGRIAACGAIASYSGDDPAGELLGPAWRLLAVKRLSARGFIIDDDADTFPEFLAEVAPLVRDGSILYRESVADGLEAAPEALVGLLRGENFGKQLVRAAAEPGRRRATAPTSRRRSSACGR
jgi:NADPH-dependent curcumin reductase CurA